MIPQDLKLKYYEMMIQYALQHSEYLDAAKYYHKIWETASIKADTNGRGREVSARAVVLPAECSHAAYPKALEHIVYYIVLAPHDNEQSDMLHRLYNDSALSNLELN